MTKRESNIPSSEPQAPALVPQPTISNRKPDLAQPTEEQTSIGARQLVIMSSGEIVTRRTAEAFERASFERASSEHRRKQIELVLRVEFPGARSPPPQISDRRAELAKMTSEQLNTLAEFRRKQHEDQDRIRRDKQTPLACEPDWEFWIQEDEWLLSDAACLLVSLDPFEGLGAHVGPALSDPAAHKHVIDELSDRAKDKLGIAMEIVRRMDVAARKNKLTIEHGAVEPRSFLRWARGKSYDIPSPLLILIADNGKFKGHTHATEKATRASSEKRQSKNISRDRLIHDASTTGKSPKQIGADKSIVGEKELSASQIRRILKKPLP